MVLIITDFDGILIYTEMAKAISYLAAVKALIRNPDERVALQQARKFAAEWAATGIPSGIYEEGKLKALPCAGGKREEFARGVWQAYPELHDTVGKLQTEEGVEELLKENEGDGLEEFVLKELVGIMPDDKNFETYWKPALRSETGLFGKGKKEKELVDKKLTEYSPSIITALEAIRGRRILQNVRSDKEVKDTIIEKLAEPMPGNIDFFAALSNAMSAVYSANLPINLPMGLITQSEPSAVVGYFEDSKRFGLPHIFGEREGRSYRFVECTGGEGTKASKKDAYISLRENMHRVYQQMGIDIGEAITFEDTRSGVEEAFKASITCVGVCEKKDAEALRQAGAAYVISGTEEEYKQGLLEKLKGAARGVVRAKYANEAVEVIKGVIPQSP